MANAFIFIRMDFLSYGYGLVWFGSDFPNALSTYQNRSGIYQCGN